MFRRTLVVACMAVCALVVPAVAAQADLRFETLSEFTRMLREIRSAPSTETAQDMVDALWTALLMDARIPLVFPGGEVVFMYRGEADTVEWRGDFTHWQSDPGFIGTRVAGTDLWVLQVVIPRDARIEYKIVLDGEQWLLDPSNPHTVPSGSGPNSEIRMPAHIATDWTDARPDVPRGNVSEQTLIDSALLGYTLSYWVYTPAGYDDLQDLTTLYVLDGNDFIAEMMGRLPHALDNLIAEERIEPVIAVFISARDPFQFQINRRESEYMEDDTYAAFIADELVPVIDAAYRTDASPDGRILMGTSFGGLGAAYIAALRHDIFAQVALFSPSLWASKRLDLLDLNAIDRMKVYIYTGQMYWDVGDLNEPVDNMRRLGFEVLFDKTQEGHSWETWRAQLDEMLVYFLGS